MFQLIDDQELWVKFVKQAMWHTRNDKAEGMIHYCEDYVMFRDIEDWTVMPWIKNAEHAICPSHF